MLNEKEHNVKDWNAAMTKACEFNYDKIDKDTKIPLGIFYNSQSKTLEERNPILNKFMKSGRNWKDIKR
jgi:hypothetical protein